jgi:transposase
MLYRYDLTDAQWYRIADLFPERYHHGKRGHPWKPHRNLVNGILWHLHTGAPWPDTPERYGPWQTVYDRFNRWRKDGTWAKILDALLLQLDKAGLIERDLWCFDGTISRAHTAAAGAKKKSRPAAAVGRAGVAANAGARRPCAGSFTRRLRHQDALGL